MRRTAYKKGATAGGRLKILAQGTKEAMFKKRLERAVTSGGQSVPKNVSHSIFASRPKGFRLPPYG